MTCVYIPIENSEEEVRVSLEQLPHDASEILDILIAEKVSLDLWLIIAREYFKQGKIQQFRQILEEGSSPDIDKHYADAKYEGIAILNALGAYHSYLGKIETNQREKDDHFIEATKYYNKASRIDVHEPSTWVGKGQLLLAKRELEHASSVFEIVLDGDRDNVPALLGQACVHFNRERYSDALDHYKRALRVHPTCPAAVRLGIGLCHYKLGNFGKARQAFQRVLQLDHDNVEALVALGIMDLQTNNADGVREGMEKMQAAFQIYPYCEMALNHLADHFFFTGQGQHILVETALAVSDHGRMKYHSYYNLGRLYHSKGDYEKARLYYTASAEESSRPCEFVLPYFGLGQVELKRGDFKGSLSNFEKVREVYPENPESLKIVGHIYVQLGNIEKALEFLKKATRIDPRDAQAFLELGELLLSSDTGSALDAFQTARCLLRKNGEEASTELLNNIGVLHFKRAEFESAEQTFKEALGDGVWSSAIGTEGIELEEGISVDLCWDKVTTLFNYARLLEQMHNTVKASILYRLILLKYPDYLDARLRLAAIAKSRNDIQLSRKLINKAIEVNDKCTDAYLMRGALELKRNDWPTAETTFLEARDATGEEDSYTALSLGNCNYFAAVCSEKLEATHLKEAKELYTNVLHVHPSNLFAANGAAVVLAEKGQFDISKDIFTQVLEADVYAQMPDVRINLAHVYFAQGQYALAVKMYENCLRKFYYNTDTEILLYLARTHYEAEQWQDCKKALLRAIHMAPSNYTLRYNAGVAMQKFSASILKKTKRTANEVRSTVSELRNAVCLFSQIRGFGEKKIEKHVAYCKHLLEAAKVHCEAAEREERQNCQKLEVARQLSLAEEARRKAEEQRKCQLERRKQEDEIKQVKQQEEYFERVKEQWRSSSTATKRKKWSHAEDKEGGHSKSRKRKGGKRRKKDKEQVNNKEENAQDLLAEAGLEDSDVEEGLDGPSESDEEKPSERKLESDNLAEPEGDILEEDGN